MDQKVTLFYSLDDLELLSSAQRDGGHRLDIAELVEDTLQQQYGAVGLPLTNNNWRDRWKRLCLSSDGSTSKDTSLQTEAELWRAGQKSFQLDEVVLARLEESPNVIAFASDWISLDARDEWVRHDAEIALYQEVAWAGYLNVQTLVLPPPRDRAHVASYARAVNASVDHIGSAQLYLSIRIPIYDPHLLMDGAPCTELTPEARMSMCWEMWDTIRTMCAYTNRISLTLDLNMSFAVQNVPYSFDRWISEPTRHIILPASSFVPNPKGYPVLTKPLQQFIRNVVKHRPTWILSQTEARMHTSGGSLAYLQYIQHLTKTSPSIINQNTPGTLANFTAGWGDYLQSPLQPLQDNLGSATYDVFESCPIKYKRYEQAITQAIRDRTSLSPVTIYVVGAGRGPLVDCALRALETCRANGVIWAIEKNPNAFVTLQYRSQRTWKDRVTLWFGDMRQLATPAEENKADILVSELLGSFGDNELSPECLDGAERFLKPNGISIPASYSAFLSPISTSRIYSDILVRDSRKDYETPYVVCLNEFDFLAGDSSGGASERCGSKIQECWEFYHPRTGTSSSSTDASLLTNSHNLRSAKLLFHIPTAGVLHGFAGYFESVLYGDIGLSTHPDRIATISPDMTSWFPIFFPIKDPLYLPNNAELHVSIWRLTDKKRVWYEWFAESFLPVPGGTQPLLNASGSSTRMPTTPLRVPSPMIDATSPSPQTSGSYGNLSRPILGDGFRAVKIGQTALHNPSGRSSWIGL